MAHDVFVSCSSQDKPTADAIVASLEANGIRCWVAPRDILPGSDWSESIVEAIEQAGTMILVLSAHSNTSPQIRREIERAVDTGIPVIPFRIEEVMPSKSLQYFIGPQHWLDAWTPPLEQHLHRLTETIKALLSKRLEGFDAAKREPQLKPPADTAVEAPAPAAAAPPPPPPAAARAETPVASAPGPPAKKFAWTLPLILAVSLAAAALGGGAVWWFIYQPAAPPVAAPRLPSPAPPLKESKPEVQAKKQVPPRPHNQAEMDNLLQMVVDLPPELAQKLNLQDNAGIAVVKLGPGTPSVLAIGDVILEINGQPVRTVGDYQALVSNLETGATVRLLIMRAGKDRWRSLFVTMEIP